MKSAWALRWSASRQLGFLSLLCLVDIFVSISLSGMPVNKLGVAKRIDHYKQQHLNIFFSMNLVCERTRNKITKHNSNHLILS